ncbi:uncharacterized protein [Rutidosis leptorrhynchoides]|uniref:uncharacterized protein n=1 Tax=Rutidosis leptorrhynchoides TaxID=125765 RepID=UPI003A998161
MVGKNPSDLWLALCESRQVLLRGGRWRLENGLNIRVFSHRWVKNLPNFKVPFPSIMIDLDLRVSSLLEWCLLKWKVSLLRSLFSSDIVNAIIVSSLLSLECSDQLVWCHSRNGDYQFKSGYYIAKQLLTKSRAIEDRPAVSTFT